MMLQKKSNAWARLKYAYVLPLAAISVIAFARPEISQPLDEISNAKVSHLIWKVNPPEVEKSSPEEIPGIDPALSAINQVPDTTIFVIVEEPPEFPGGNNARINYLSQNLRYPKHLQEDGIQGRVLTQFVVEKDGSISNVEIIRGVVPEMDAEAVRLILSMPKWTSGKQRGQNVRVRFTLPVSFRLSAETQPVNPPPNSSAGSQISDTTIFITVEEQPQFPGSETARTEYINQNVRYPEKAKEGGVQGRVSVQFIVEKDGSLTNVEIIRGVDPELDAEAVRLVRSMPKWTPGKQRGQNVRVRFVLPITFRLQN